LHRQAFRFDDGSRVESSYISDHSATCFAGTPRANSPRYSRGWACHYTLGHYEKVWGNTGKTLFWQIRGL